MSDRLLSDRLFVQTDFNRHTADTHSAAAAATSAATDHAELRKEISDLKKMLTAMTLPGASPHPRPPRDQKSYCFVHGTTYHKGTKCKVMINKPEMYTTAMIQATGPCTLNNKAGEAVQGNTK